MSERETETEAESSRRLYSHEGSDVDSEQLSRAIRTPMALRQSSTKRNRPLDGSHGASGGDGGGVSVSALERELEMVKKELEEKDNDAQMAAKLGQQLLHSNDVLRAEIEQLRMRLEASHEKSNALHVTIAEGTTENTKLRTANLVLTSQMKDAQKENQNLVNELYALEERLEQETAKTKASIGARERLTALEQELDTMQAVKEEAVRYAQREKELTEANAILQRTCQDHKGLLDELSKEREFLQAQVLQAKEESAQLRSTQQENTRLIEELRELQEEKRILETMPLNETEVTGTLRSFLVENRTLLESLRDGDEVINEAVHTVEALLQGSDDTTDTDKSTSDDARPKNAFYLLLAVLTQRKREELERKLRVEVKRAQELSDELAEALGARDADAEKITRLGRLNEKLEEQNNGLMLQMEEKEEALDEELRSLRKELEEAKTHKVPVEVTVKDEATERELKAAREEIEDLKRQAKALKDEKKKHHEREQELSSQLSEARQSMEETANALRESNLAQADLRVKVDALTDENKSLSHAKKAQEGLLQAARERYQAAAARRAALEGDVTSLLEEIDTYKLEHEISKEEKEILEKEASLQQRRVAEMADALDRERKRQGSSSDHWVTQVSQLTDELAEERELVQQLLEEKLELQEAGMQTEIELQEERESLLAENSRLKQLTASSKSEIQLLEDSKAHLEALVKQSLDDLEKERNLRVDDLKQYSSTESGRDSNLTRLANALTEASKRKIELEGMVYARDKQIRVLALDLKKSTAIGESIRTSLARFQESFKSLQMEKTELQATMSHMLKDSRESAQLISELTEDLEDERNTNNALRKQIADLEARIRHLELLAEKQRPFRRTLPPPNELVIDVEWWAEQERLQELEELMAKELAAMVEEEKDLMEKTPVKPKQIDDGGDIISPLDLAGDEDKSRTVTIEGKPMLKTPRDLRDAVEERDKEEWKEEKEEQFAEEEEEAFFEEEETELMLTAIADVLDGDREGLVLDKGTKRLLEDGRVLCELINAAAPGTVDERALNEGEILTDSQKRENMTLCLNSAKAIGCDVNQLTPDTLSSRAGLEELAWEVVKVKALKSVSTDRHPELLVLQSQPYMGGAEVEVESLPPLQLLLFWFNHHLEMAAHSSRRLEGFSDDLSDGELYLVLLSQLSSKLKDSEEERATENERVLSYLSLSPQARVSHTLEIIRDIGVKGKFSPTSILAGNERVNTVLCSRLMDLCSGLRPKSPAPEEKERYATPKLSLSNTVVRHTDEGTREERAFCMWINSLGIGYVSNLQSDVRDGTILLGVFDVISPGLVPWRRVNKDPSGIYRKMENCALCVSLGKKLGFSLVGIGGKDFYDGNRTLILALVWQMYQYHLLSILCGIKGTGEKVTTPDVLQWANSVVAEKKGEEHCTSSLKDPALSTSLFLAHLLDGLHEGAINYLHINEASTEDEKKANAKYVISVARKLGCCIFLVWEDIVEVDQKMIFTLVATLMSLATRQD